MPLPFFVYGTLLTGQSNAQLLRGAIARTRAAKLSGAQMFDMGPYPMIIEGEGENLGRTHRNRAGKIRRDSAFARPLGRRQRRRPAKPRRALPAPAPHRFS